METETGMHLASFQVLYLLGLMNFFSCGEKRLLKHMTFEIEVEAEAKVEVETCRTKPNTNEKNPQLTLTINEETRTVPVVKVLFLLFYT